MEGRKPLARRCRKRSRKTKSNDQDTLPVPAYFFRLPFELLAEVLLYTASPKDVLAVARCSKFLCTTLLREESCFIWRSVRARCLPGPLPDPLPNLSESAYAAMLFDTGNCETCGAFTTNMYASFSLKLRFCRRPECKSGYLKKNLVHTTPFEALDSSTRKVLQWIPLAESAACVVPLEDPSVTWPTAHKIWNKATMAAALVEYNVDTPDVVNRRHEVDISRSPLKMSFYVSLHIWKYQRQQLAKDVRSHNDNFTRALALKEGYDYLELLNSSKTFQELYSARNRNLEHITRADYDVVSAQVEAEMIVVREKQERSIGEDTIRSNRTQVSQHYHRLVSSATKVAVMPSLSQFRAMPILDLLQSASASTPTPTQVSRKAAKTKKAAAVALELKTPTLVSQLLDAELAKWRKGAEAALAVTLGVPEWKTARRNRLHPVTRLTARWKCGQCQSVGSAYKWDGCLDYEGVCKHECTKTRKQKTKKGASGWKAENFVKDDKAINAMTKLVKLCGIDAEDEASFQALEDIGPRILCLSCEAAIVMRPGNVVGHSHRHDDMEMTLLTQAEADALLVAPLQSGLPMRLMAHDDYKVKKAQEKWKYACRHCTQRHPPPPVAEEPPLDVEMADAAAPGDAETANVAQGTDAAAAAAAPKDNNQKKQPRRLEFNGLRSHLKEKHSIHLPRDEDFYHLLTPPVVPKPRSRIFF